MKTKMTIRTLALTAVATAALALPLGASADSAFHSVAKAPRHESHYHEVNRWYLDRHHEMRGHHYHKVYENKHRWHHDHGRHLGHYDRDRDYDRHSHVTNVQVIEAPQRHEPVHIPRDEGGRISISYEIRI